MGYPPLELVSVEFEEAPPAPVASHPRGVFREAGTPPGVVVLVGYDHLGVRRFRHEMLEADVDPQTVPRLERKLHQLDPRFQVI